MATTLGVELVRRALPDKYKHEADTAWTSKQSSKVLTALAKEDPDAYVEILQKLNDIGRNVVADYGRDASLSVSDILPSPAIRKFQNTLRTAVRGIYNDPKLSNKEKTAKIVALGQRFYKKAQDLAVADADARGTSLGTQIKAGARGKPLQLMQMMVGTILNSDAKGRAIPYLGLSNYSGGVDPLEFWIGSSGARKGYYDVQFATAESGYLSKQISNAIHDTPISTDDCHTMDTGVPVKADSSDNLGAVLLKPFKGYPAGSVVTEAMIADAGDDDEMIVRSPMTCMAKGGVCAKCSGLNENGKFPRVGEYVALNASKSFAEPLTQSSVGCLHPDTEVQMADGTVKLLRDIVVGDLVLGADDLGKTFPVVVSRVYHSGIRRVYRHTFQAKDQTIELLSTETHKVLYRDHLMKRRVSPIKQVHGDCAVLLKGGYAAQYKDSSFVCEHECLDIEVDSKDHLFVLANGMIVSNSKHAAAMRVDEDDDESVEDMVHGLPAVNQMLSAPSTFRGRAVIAPQGGTITAIREAPQGGSYIYMDGKVSGYIPVNRKLKVAVGDKVDAGDVLTNGIPNPKDIMDLKGVGLGRTYFTRKFAEILKDAGAGTQRRNVEQFSRAFLNKVKVTDPDGYRGALPGDLISYSDLQAEWVPREDSKQMVADKAVGKYLDKPVLNYSIGTKVTPTIAQDLKKHSFNDIVVNDKEPPFQAAFVRSSQVLGQDPDWMARMSGERLKDSLADAAQRGLETPYDSRSMYSKIVTAPYRQN